MNQRGTLHLVVGPMYSGKTEYILRKYKKILEVNAQNKSDSLKIFKPDFDTRDNDIHSRSGYREDAIVVKNAIEILKHITPKTQYVFIDEIQFFDKSLKETIKKLLDKKMIIYVGGLNKDAYLNNFERYNDLLPLANYITMTSGICQICDESVSLYSKKTSSNNEEKVFEVEGDKKTTKYFSVCKNCWSKKI